MNKKFLSAVFVLFVWCKSFVVGFNIDVRHPLVYSDTTGSLFGFTVQLMKNSQGIYSLLVGAPAGNSSYDSSFQPGVIFACRIGNDQCRELYYSQADTLIMDPEFNYVELRNGSWLGVSIDVSLDESQFVACGHLWKNMIHRGDYLTNGICYVHNADLNVGAVRVLMPLINSRMQVIDRKYVYALGLAGMSAHFASDGSNLLIGAPGVQQLAGSVISMPLSNLAPTRFPRRPNFNIPVPSPEMRDDSYFGYAVTSGRFYTDKSVYYVAGAPREGVNGMAFIYQMSEVQNDNVLIKTSLNGNQMGEYFGSSLCAVDVNGDGFSDLLVGAPLHSIEGDEGSVYVYISYKTFLQLSTNLLSGSAVVGSRFGTCISAVGDVNLDGYQDVAIGAPYEGNGAVYVYHGSKDGLVSKVAQKILASEVNTNLRGFGISISKGRDIDGNSYSDFAVGSYVSSNAVILRSRPIIKVTGTIALDTNHVNAQNKTCDENGRLVACFNVNVCTTFDGQKSPDTVDFEVVVDNDVFKKDDFQSPRVYFYVTDRPMSNLNFVITLRRGQTKCRQYSVHVKDDIYDFLTPIEFRMSLKLKEDVSRSSFCKDCPVIDPVASGNITKDVTFLTGCKEDHCISDLKLKADIIGYPQGTVMVLGEKDVLQLQVEVNNEGDPAFQTVLRVVFPPKVDFSRIPSSCSSYHENASVALFCNLGNPMNANKPVTLSIGVDVKKLTSDVLELPFNFTVSTVSDETETSKKDNNVVLILPVKSIADIGVKGWQLNEDHIFFNRSNPDAVYVTHLYEISKTDPSPVRDVTLEIKFPISTFEQVSFFNKPINMGVFFNYQPVNNKCEVKVVRPTVVVPVQQVDTENGKASILDCSSMTCHVVKCYVGPFIKQDVATVNITALVDLPVLITLAGNSEIFQLRSSVVATIMDENMVEPSSENPAEAIVVTTFLPQDLALQPSELPGWVIPLAVIGGLILLAAIVAVMYKFGFFKRTIKEDMMHSALTETGNESNNEDETNNLNSYHVESS